MSLSDTSVFDCIVIGAGPGGLQAAIHLARYNRQVLLLDKGGGRTKHARHLENYLGIDLGTGVELIATGLSQVRRFGVRVEKAVVDRVEKQGDFLVHAGDAAYKGRFVVASTGGTEMLPTLKGLGRHFARSIHTCVDCDGYRTIGKKLVFIGESMDMVRLAVAMRQMYTEDVTVIPMEFSIPEEDRELLEEDGITVVEGEPSGFVGEEALIGVELADGRVVPCEAVMLGFDYALNDGYLRGLPLERDAEGYNIVVKPSGETSLSGLYAVGALRQGHSQAIIAAGQGAVAAIDINARLLEL